MQGWLQNLDWPNIFTWGLQNVRVPLFNKCAVHCAGRRQQKCTKLTLAIYSIRICTVSSSRRECTCTFLHGHKQTFVRSLSLSAFTVMLVMLEEGCPNVTMIILSAVHIEPVGCKSYIGPWFTPEAKILTTRLEDVICKHSDITVWHNDQNVLQSNLF